MTIPKHVSVSLKAGSPRTEVVSPGAVSRLGSQTGGPPLIQRTAPEVRMGNDLAQGPGGGRSVLRSGSQSSTPQPKPMPPGGAWALWRK